MGTAMGYITFVNAYWLLPPNVCTSIWYCCILWFQKLANKIVLYGKAMMSCATITPATVPERLSLIKKYFKQTAKMTGDNMNGIYARNKSVFFFL